MENVFSVNKINHIINKSIVILKKELKDAGFRVETDEGNENLGTKIKKYRLQRTPYTVIIGAEEVSNGKLSIRTRSSQEINCCICYK